MAATTSFGNGTTVVNTSEYLDLFCVKLLAGPLWWAIISVPCSCVGVPASACLLWVLIQRRQHSSSNNVYMLNLTIMDLIYNVSTLPFVLNFFVWHDSELYMIMYGVLGLNFNGRPLLMACSCVDCYLAVVHPIMYMRISQSRYRPVVSALVWVSASVLALLYRFAFSVKTLVNAAVLFIPCVFAISTIILCDFVVLCTLRKPDPSGRSDIHPQKQRALQTIINSVIITLVSYLPMLLLMMHADLIPLSKQETYCHLYMPALVFSMLGSTILPLLYLRNLGSFNGLRGCDCIRRLAV